MGPVEQKLRTQLNLGTQDINLMEDLNLQQRIDLLSERSASAAANVRAYEPAWREQEHTDEQLFFMRNNGFIYNIAFFEQSTTDVISSTFFI